MSNDTFNRRQLRDTPFPEVVDDVTKSINTYDADFINKRFIHEFTIKDCTDWLLGSKAVIVPKVNLMRKLSNGHELTNQRHGLVLYDDYQHGVSPYTLFNLLAIYAADEDNHDIDIWFDKNNSVELVVSPWIAANLDVETEEYFDTSIYHRQGRISSAQALDYLSRPLVCRDENIVSDSDVLVVTRK